jgi:hypothetical protein
VILRISGKKRGTLLMPLQVHGWTAMPWTAPPPVSRHAPPRMAVGTPARPARKPYCTQRDTDRDGIGDVVTPTASTPNERVRRPSIAMTVTSTS